MPTVRSPLSRTMEYALRAMVHLSRAAPGARVRGRDLAAASRIPAPYLSKVLRRLTAAGLLTSQKGHGGGFSLARAPETIRFLDIIRAEGLSSSPDHCVFGWESCDESRPCPLHPPWSQLKEAIELWAREQTLADVIDRDPPLSRR